ncbi:MAG: hypothetical protein PHT12_03310 [Patescibacteria group bacterium]|nr:hypothetical protein [Patescibacteria group bacterium]
METAFSRLKIRLVTAGAGAVVGFLLLAFPAHAGAMENVTGWLWSGTAGWISMNCTNFGTCATSDYGANLDYAAGGGSSGELTGWGWSETFGWVCFGKTCPDDVKNPENTPQNYAELREYVDDGTPGGRHWQFYGWARILNMGANGWLSLNCYNETHGACAGSNYYVSYDISTGFFSNVTDVANRDRNHYGWSGNSDGTGIGWVDFSLAHGNWAPPVVGPVIRPEGVYEPAGSLIPGTHPSQFEIRLPSVSSPQNFLLECVLSLPNGVKRILSKPVESVWFNVAESFLYQVPASDRGTDAIQRGKLWYIETCRLLDKPGTQACVADDDCVSGFCRPDPALPSGPNLCRAVADASTPKPLYIHDNRWSLYGADDDFYRAVKCYATFADQFFRNANRCDFAGDASFSMAMSKGIPIERDCHNGVDDDLNGLTDCEDPFCKGISYFCKPEEKRHLPTRCIWSEAGQQIPRCGDLTYKRSNLCCNDQPDEQGSNFHYVVDAMECEYGNPADGYFDCDCQTQEDFDANPNDDCYAPGHQSGNFCCERITQWPSGDVIGSRVMKK